MDDEDLIQSQSEQTILRESSAKKESDNTKFDIVVDSFKKFWKQIIK